MTDDEKQRVGAAIDALIAVFGEVIVMFRIDATHMASSINYASPEGLQFMERFAAKSLQTALHHEIEAIPALNKSVSIDDVARYAQRLRDGKE